MESSEKVTRFYQKELRNSLVGIGVIPVLLITILFYNLFFYLSYQSIKSNNVSESEHVAKEVVHKFSYLSEQSQILSRQIDISRLEASSEYRSKVYESLYKSVNSNNFKSLFSVIDLEDNVLATNWVETPADNHKNAVWYLNKKLKAGFFQGSIMYPNKQNLENDRIFYNIANPIYSKEGRLTGYIVFNLLENQFRQLINNVHYTDILITDQYGHSVLTSNEMLLTQSGKLNASESEDYVINKTAVLNDTIEVNAIIYVGLFKKIYKYGLLTLLAVFLLITIGTVFIANYISRKKMASIDQLLSMIHLAKKGLFKQNISMKKKDEFLVIAEYLQQLLRDIENLIQKNKESVERTSQAEIKQLETQINPHFLFNTLETIKYMIQINPEKAEELIIILSKLMRYSLDNKMQLNKIHNDTSYLFDYLTLQKIRFGERLEYTINVQEKANNYLIPKLIVQPLIENSIKYGFTKMHLKIDVVIRSTKRNVYLIIRDNGEGIDREKIAVIQSGLKEVNNQSNHIGIYNVHRRIQLLYGNRYGLKIYSEKGRGTLIVVRIPIVKGVN
ncbi:hypothetical protein CYL18_16335 [Pradoshia eiseniae]|uniref:Histidine kinase/HSP90-like ATPase domain-containing protein n=1 Tax=Pradoshia eiseniae TaxID=2064768 RepID=A0A2S7MW51_9BACI|nr:histidine kinase [Pradoshia eiseniae]PQD94041.1 hypothetical protein CYL18_16335 [Pradoshia eiseniae]